MKINISRSAGFTLVEIMIVVAIIGLLAAIAIPNFAPARATTQEKACINNLRQIDDAKQQWALDTKQSPTAIPSAAELAPYLGRGVAGLTVNTGGGLVDGMLNCPSSGTYAILSVSLKPTCTVTDHGLQ